jgi:hypothetical protein
MKAGEDGIGGTFAGAAQASMTIGFSRLSTMALQQLRPQRAVDDPVIDAERDGHDRGHGQFAIRADDGFLHARAHREDRAVGRVDDGVEIVDAEHAEVGDREAAADIFMRREFRSRARAARSFISPKARRAISSRRPSGRA